MSDFLDRFGDQLQAAHARGSIVAAEGGGTRLGRVRAAGRRRRGLVLAVASLLVAAPALAVVGPWRPSLERSGIDQPVSVDDSPVAGSAVAAFGVLRRDQTASDREKAAPVLHAVGAGNQVDRVQTDGIRAVGNGWALVPAKTTQTSPSLKANEDVLCLTDGTKIGCSPTQAAATNGVEVVSASTTQTEIAGLVPDGVAAVQFAPSEGKAVEVPVSSNFFSLSVAQVAPARKIKAPAGYKGRAVIDGPPLPVAGTLRWLDSSGTTLGDAHHVG